MKITLPPGYESESDLFQYCVKAINSWYSYMSANIINFRAGTALVLSKQWDENVEQDYEQRQRPTLTFNFIRSIIDKMVGEMTASDIDPQPIPKSVDVPQKIVDMAIQILKTETYNSDLSSHTEKAYESALMGGWGAYLFGIKYKNSKTFEQVPEIRSVEDALLCFFDPLARMRTKEDGEFCGNLHFIRKEDFERQYPGKPYIQSGGLFTAVPQIILSNYINCTAICVFYLKVKKKKVLVGLSNGKDYKVECFKEDIKKEKRIYYGGAHNMGMSLTNIPALHEDNRRETYLEEVYEIHLTASQLLSCKKFPIDALPLVYVDGGAWHIDGSDIIVPFALLVRDPQRFYNFSMSLAAYQMSTARNEAYMGTREQVRGNEYQWQNPAIQQGILIFNPDQRIQPNGAPIPVPRTEVSQSTFVAANQASTNINQILGMLDPVTGTVPYNSSGVAVNSVMQSQNLVVKKYRSGVDVALKRIGELTLKSIPVLYDTKRNISIKNKDGTRHYIKMNGEEGEDNSFPALQIDELFEGLQVNTSSSFAAQQQIVLQILLQLIQMSPTAVLPLIADLLPKEMDISIASVLEQRLKYLVPQYVLAGQAAPPPPPPQPPPPDSHLQVAMIKAQTDAQEVQMKVQIEHQRQQIEVLKTQMDFLKEKERGKTELVTQLIKSEGEIRKAVVNSKKQI